MRVENNPLAILYTLRKDHKKAQDVTKGPPCRPVCGANSAFNHKLSYIISQLIRPIWENNNHVCCSTEEMLHGIQEVNNRKLDKNLFIGSADVTALYPSLDIKHTAEIVSKIFLETNIKVEGVDDEELGLYLSLNIKEQQLEKLGIRRFCPTKRLKTGRPPNITGSVNKKDRDKYKPWIERTHKPNQEETKQMLSIALEIAIIEIMTNHIYRINNKIKKQQKGGPIGLDLTGDLAQIYMIWYDNELIKSLKKHNIDVVMYQRYVDDINIVMTKTDNPHNDTQQEDNHLMNVVREIGNKIHPSIKLQTDSPSKHPDGKMPILDIKVWIEKRKENNINNHNNKNNLILYEFFSKPMSSKIVMHSSTAFPIKTKITILTQELLRIFLRCSQDIEWENTTQHANEFMRKLQFSGYPTQIRTIITRSALKALETIKEKDKTGIQPMYRDKDWRRKERLSAKNHKKENWFKTTKKEESVLFVPATPQSELKREYDKIIKNRGINIKVVEKGGTQLLHKLRKNDILETQNRCSCHTCLSNPNKIGLCKIENTVYCIECDECGDKYVGETSRAIQCRIQEHLNAFTNNTNDSVLARHYYKERTHNKEAKFTIKIIKKFKDALRRQVAENVYINKFGTINGRAEFGSGYTTSQPIPTKQRQQYQVSEEGQIVRN